MKSSLTLKSRICASVVVIVCSMTIVWLRQPVGPKHNGKPLKEWMMALLTDEPAKWTEARTAIRAIGTNALPTLMDWFNHKDSKVEKKLQVLLAPHTDLMGEHSEAHYRRLGQWGLQILGPIAEPVIPQLRPVLDDPDARRANAALHILARVAPDEIKTRYRTAMDDPDPGAMMKAADILVIVAPEEMKRRSDELRASSNRLHQAYGRKIIQELFDAQLPRTGPGR